MPATKPSTSFLQPIVRVVRRLGSFRSALSGVWFECGSVRLRGQAHLVWRHDGRQWLSASPGQFPGAEAQLKPKQNKEVPMK